MANARRGLYIRVGYSILRDGIPEDLASVTALTVIFRHICQPNSSVMYTGEKLTTYANTVSATITDTDQAKLASGDYKIEVYYRRANPNNESGYEPYVIDAPAFTLTDTSTEVNTTTYNGITIQTINLAGEVSFCSQELEDLILASQAAIRAANDAADAANTAAAAAMGIVNSKIDLDGLNSNIRQLKFNTATPIAPTQAGQMAWSDEEKTLELHNGYHSTPINMESFFTAKNQSGALIANGKAVYAIGSTGANATIGLATTANGDIAQHTIGIATMDIASNGFGDVTTFGEVNAINTSGLTEGALIYLGLDGNLTSIEPVAPTPKVSLGLCIRSHLTQGRIAVYVRPIARLNKLTDVYAPNLLDGDVLRWNGTALRYEIYNLVNKADLVDGKVPASQLPAYVDDILEFANFAAFPLVGETSKLYVTLDTNLTYRWSGSTYTEVSKSLALGITSTTAFRGDWGKIAYDHSQLTNSNPHGTTAAQIANTPAGTISATTVQAAINELDAGQVQLETDLNTKKSIVSADDDHYRLINLMGLQTGYAGYIGNYTLHGFEYTPEQNDDIVTLIGNTNYNTNKPIQSQMRPFEELITTKARFYLRDDLTKRIDGSVSNLTNPDYLQKVYIPEFWYGAMFDSVRNKVQVWFSLTPVDWMMYVAPQAVTRYGGYIDASGKARSHSGYKFPNNKNLIEFTTACQLTSPDLFVLPFYVYNALALLLLHDIGRRNAQAVWQGLLSGSTYGNVTSGKTDALRIPNGEVPADAETASCKPFRWRFIEDFYANYWKIMSGVYCNQVGAERRVMICADPYKANTTSTITADYIQACVIAAGEGWVKDVNLPWIAAKMYGATSTTGFGDYAYNNTADKTILFSGGSSGYGVFDGPFYLYSYSSASTRHSTIGALFASIDRLPAATQVVKPALIY